MAAGLGFKTFTTGEVLTAGDVNGYLMQGINVFASSAARASAITSPQEGQYSYLKDTNSLEYYTGAAWVAQGGGGGGGGYVFIKKVDFTTASTIDFSDSFSSTYDHYSLQGTLTSSADGDLNFRWRVSGSDNSSSNYNYQLADIVNTSANNARVTGQTAGRFAATRTSSGRTSLKVELYNPFKSETKNWVGHAAVQVTSDVYVNQITGGFNDNTSFTGMTIYPSSGTVSGTLRIYGYQNS